MQREGFSIQSAKLNLKYEDFLELVPGGADIYLIEDEVTGKYMIMITPESQGAGLPYYTDILLNVINLIGSANIYGYRFQKSNEFGGGDIVVVLNLDIS